jgi:hypothetical protein
VRSWLKDHGLGIVTALLFVAFLVGTAVAGNLNYNQDQLDHGEQPVSLAGYLVSPSFGEAVFENWESEFLQMGMLIVLTIFLFHRGSAESKPIDEEAEQDKDPREFAGKKSAPWPVRRGGWVLVLYENSLVILFAILFIASFTLHAVTGAADYSEEQLTHGASPVGAWEYLATSRFWFESFQNWQSEFLVVAVMVVASVFLRQRGSAESKPVAAAHSETSA